MGGERGRKRRREGEGREGEKEGGREIWRYGGGREREEGGR